MKKPFFKYPKPLTVTEEQVLEASKTSPQAKEALMKLFPSVFIMDEPFCKIGATFIRKGNYKSIYAVMQRGGKVQFINVTSDYVWSSKNELDKDKLKYSDSDRLTRREFEVLLGSAKFEDFVQFWGGKALEELANNQQSQNHWER